MKYSFWLLLLLISCGRKDDKIVDTTPAKSNSIVEERISVPHVNKHIFFLGHEIQCSDLQHEWNRICAEDVNLSYDSINQNIILYGTTFHLNYRNNGDGFMLMASVQPDTRQIRTVRDAISKFHGKENFEEDYHYS